MELTFIFEAYPNIANEFRFSDFPPIFEKAIAQAFVNSKLDNRVPDKFKNLEKQELDPKKLLVENKNISMALYNADSSMKYNRVGCEERLFR